MVESILQVATGLFAGVELCVFVIMICIDSFFLLKFSEVSCSHRILGGLVKTVRGRGVLFVNGISSWCLGMKDVTALLIDFQLAWIVS